MMSTSPQSQPQQRTAKITTAPVGEPITEEQLKKKDNITPDDVLRLRQITEGFLCRSEDNVYDIEFTKFKIRDIDTDTILFEVNKPTAEELNNIEQEEEEEETTDEKATDEETTDEEPPFSPRFIRYYFKSSFLQLKNVGATMEFIVGDKPVHKFRMIERHYFKEKLLKSFDFEFGFCIPHSKNTCEHIYHIPQLGDDMMKQMIDNPFETRSDSFYFVDDHLIMHNKAAYAYDANVV
ncbi:unnamed protein product [Bursaphelenchus okinawaensis]|uniref:GMP phosphodiesterase delta subunit domain-containing protein n=1 Tax=Bursaphelenchus okinawaensis TaxID=465554 RepID=A0A811KQT5_9BILA|nr:unnamed protein product [Bursaphelenchus okinawaensis]CAG9109358.1 unnamed protein product [Bursaphelenchus okinawaensis]